MYKLQADPMVAAFRTNPTCFQGLRVQVQTGYRHGGPLRCWLLRAQHQCHPAVRALWLFVLPPVCSLMGSLYKSSDQDTKRPGAHTVGLGFATGLAGCRPASVREAGLQDASTDAQVHVSRSQQSWVEVSAGRSCPPKHGDSFACVEVDSTDHFAPTSGNLNLKKSWEPSLIK